MSLQQRRGTNHKGRENGQHRNGCQQRYESHRSYTVSSDASGEHDKFLGGLGYGSRYYNRSPRPYSPHSSVTSGDYGGFRGGRGNGHRGGSFAPNFGGSDTRFLIHIQPDTLVYRYYVTILCIIKNPNSDIIKRRLSSEKLNLRARQFCYYVMSYVKKITQNFGNTKIQVAYDNQNELFSNMPLKEVNETISRKDLPEEAKAYIVENGEIIVTINEHQKMSTINLNDLNQYEAREYLLNEDRTVLNTLEIILYQNAIDDGNYEIIGNGKLFQKNEQKLNTGYHTRIGISKGVRMADIESKDSNEKLIKTVNPTLDVNFKKFVFYSSGLFGHLVSNFLQDYKEDEEEGYCQAEITFQNIMLFTIKEPNQIIWFKKFKLETADKNNGEATLPFVICQNNEKFPLESLRIVPNQFVKEEKNQFEIYENTDYQNDDDLQIHYGNAMAEIQRLIFDNEITKGFGISFTLKPIENIRILQFERKEKPKILIENKMIKPQENGNFYIDLHLHYYFPTTVEKWAVLYPENLNFKIEGLIERFIKAAKDRGIIFECDPYLKRYSGIRFNNFYKIFSNFHKHGNYNVLMIDNRNDSKSYGILKLMESLFKIVTQHVPMEIFEKLFYNDKNFKLATILNKFNFNNGGINYIPQFIQNEKRLDIGAENVLIIGYHILNSEEDLSVVGISTNDETDPFIFNNDWFYQKKKDSVNVKKFKLWTKIILTNSRNVKKCKLPEIIIIIRNGDSSKESKLIYQKELLLLEAECKLIDPEHKPKFIFAAATKRHYNSKAHSCVNDQRPNCVQMFLNHDKTIENTANFAEICVIRDDLNATREKLKDIYYSLCYGHQILTAPTPLPIPLFIAEEYAKKGLERYKTLKTLKPKYIPSNHEEIDYVELTNELR